MVQLMFICRSRGFKPLLIIKEVNIMTSYNFKENAWKRYEAKVCRRCGMIDEAEKLEAEADEAVRAFIEELNRQAGIKEG